MKMLQRVLLLWIWLVPMGAMAAPMVNINTADSEILVEELVGIGPQKAMAIVRYRQTNGPFQNVDDLALVTGIGSKTVDQNRSRMTIETTVTEP